ncbi:MAG TPA: trimeric intracellular cation channel family protein [Abditibacterium sp.]|jgi:uncharacterized membrane protein YeiH
MTTLQLLDLVGVATFAASGALVAGHKKLDLFGTLVVAFVSALGGGTVRDLLLGLTPVFWVKDTLPVSVALATGALTFCLMRRVLLPAKWLLFLDALGLGTFAVLGCGRALDAGASPLIATMMGMLSGVAGGAIRDVLCGEVPTILRAEVYATAALAGGALFCALEQGGVSRDGALFLGAALTFSVRVAALKWKIALPVAAVKGKE